MIGFNGSHNKYITALSGVQIASGSTGASNFAGYEFATILALAGSHGGTTNLNVLRSGTSDGVYAGFGASIAVTTGSGKMAVRSFRIDSSAIWHKLAYDKNGTESGDLSVAFILTCGRYTPVETQHADTTVYSDVI